jgi:hypothetical protein
MPALTLSETAREVAACLPLEPIGATIPDLAADVFDRPLWAQPRPGMPESERRTHVRAALREIRKRLAEAGDDDGLVYMTASHAEPGRVRRYALSRKSSGWISSYLQPLLSEAAEVA